MTKREKEADHFGIYKECDKQRSQHARYKILTLLKSVEKLSLTSTNSGFPSSYLTITKCFVAVLVRL